MQTGGDRSKYKREFFQDGISDIIREPLKRGVSFFPYGAAVSEPSLIVFPDINAIFLSSFFIALSGRTIIPAGVRIYHRSPYGRKKIEKEILYENKQKTG